MEQLGILAGTITTILEVVKQIIKPYSTQIPESVYAALIQILAMVMGVVGAYTMQLDMLVITDASDVPTIQGIVLAGILASLGNQFIHYFMDVLKK